MWMFGVVLCVARDLVFLVLYGLRVVIWFGVYSMLCCGVSCGFATCVCRVAWL